MKHYTQALGEILCRRGALSKEDAQSFKKDFKGTDREQFNYFLIDEGIVSKEELLSALSEYYEAPFFDVRGYQFNHELLALFPKDFLIAHAVIPIEFDGAILTMVTGRPDGPELTEKIQRYTQHHIEYRVGIVRDIVDEARAYYESPPDESDLEIDDEAGEESTEDIIDLY